MRGDGGAVTTSDAALARAFPGDAIVAEESVPTGAGELEALVAPAKAVFLDAKIESELIDLDPADAAGLLEQLSAVSVQTAVAPT